MDGVVRWFFSDRFVRFIPWTVFFMPFVVSKSPPLQTVYTSRLKNLMLSPARIKFFRPPSAMPVNKVCRTFNSLGLCCTLDFLRPFRTFYSLGPTTLAFFVPVGTSPPSKLSAHSQTENPMPSAPDQRYACKQCKRWFRNRSGLTQHTHAKHPRFSPPSASISPPAASDVLDDHDMDGDHFMENIEPSHSIRSKFVGPNNALFRNYHPGLTG